MRSLHAELQKAKQRHDLPLMLAVLLVVALWSNAGRPESADALAMGYRSLLHTIPMLNIILMPPVMAMLASRLWDIEIKGSAPKLLYTLQSRRALFGAKCVLGLAEVVFVTLGEAVVLVVLGIVDGFTEVLPTALLLDFAVTTLAVNAMLFLSSLLLTVICNGPIPALCVSIVGALAGLFANMVSAQLAKLVPWGYFLQLSRVQMDWNEATQQVTYPVGPLNLPLLAVTLGLVTVLLAAAWVLIREQEV